MAEWKTQLSYNYNPSYHHAYAYGIMYQAGSDPNLGPLPGWAEHGVAELGNCNAAVPQGYYAAPARPREASPPRSPERGVLNPHGHYQSSGLVYLAGSQNGRLCLPGQNATSYDPLVNDDDGGGGGRTRSGTPTSDSDAHASPDSWSSASSKEESLPQADPAVWVKKELEEDPGAGSPDTSHDLSSILEEPQSFTVVENEDPSAAYATAAVSNPTPTPKTATGRGKLRTTFSEDQMNALVQRFSAQRYLTPAEMKSLAGQSGLSYKQVKTWFQNRRMKLRRHQKDTSWVSEHYKTKKAGGANPLPVAYSNMVPRLQQYQDDGRIQLQEEYSQHIMETGYKNTAPQSLAYYLAAMGVASPAGYPAAAWSPGGARAAPLPSRQQAPGWPAAPPANQQHQHQQYAYDYTHAYAAGPPAPADSTTNVDETLHMALVQDADPRHDHL